MLVSGRCEPQMRRGIGVEVLHHVFVDKLLQIEAKRVASSTNYNVSANAGGARHVTVGIVNGCPCWIVAGGDADLRSRGGCQLFADA
jgi:hypothetical protein